MRLKVALEALLLFSFNEIAFASVSPSKLEDLKNVAMSEKEFKRVQQLHYSWYIQAIEALLGAMGKELYTKMDRNNRRAFVACLDNIDKEYDLRSGARCLVKAFDNNLVTSYPYALYRSNYDFVGNEPQMQRHNESKTKTAFATPDLTLLKLKLRKRHHPRLRHRKKDSRAKTRKMRKPFQYLHANVRRHKPVKREIRGVIFPSSPRLKRRSKRSLFTFPQQEAVVTEDKDLDDASNFAFERVNMKSMPPLATEKRTFIKVVTDFLGSFWRATNSRTEKERMPLSGTYARLLQLQNKVTKMRREARFKHRMLDMVIGKNNPLRRRKNMIDRIRDLMPDKVMDKNLYGLMKAVSRHVKNPNVQFLSPRILPLLPDKYRESGKLLSPDLFPFYKDKSKDSILPLPEVLKDVGLDSGDRKAVIELLMEVTGVNDVVEKSLQYVSDLKSLKLDKDINEITAAIDGVFRNLEKSLDLEQKQELKTRHFAFLKKEQLEKLFEKGIYNLTSRDLPFDLNKYGEMSRAELEESLRNTVRLLANESAPHGRSKRDVSVLNPTTLAPFMFAPTILTLVVLGPVTLSPYIFSPSILSPTVLSPITLSPYIFSPGILSPTVLSPPVLSPQVANPLILSPYVLGPNVLSPAVMNPYVLTPYVLSPNVLNPYVLSPLVLSPFVLSPDVLSPTVLCGGVLSPKAFSPSLASDGWLGVDVLSPSFMS
ncbi:unnamed protein product [Cylicocyclus nassatus]|uniref:Uncharacterized protein n=1 Tax=Cylicocyclus nassatus TaxID=53992 RepID=A0AA36M8Y1_CYLNA|nr:unnamed protein product [Cylicocyclus nassatus]